MIRSPRVRASSGIRARAAARTRSVNAPDRRRLAVRLGAMVALVCGLGMMLPAAYRAEPDAGASDTITMAIETSGASDTQVARTVDLLILPEQGSPHTYKIVLAFRDVRVAGELRVTAAGPAADKLVECRTASRYWTSDTSAHGPLGDPGTYPFETVDGRREAVVPFSPDEPPSLSQPEPTISKTVAVICLVPESYLHAGGLSGSLVRIPTIRLSAIPDVTYGSPKYDVAPDIAGYTSPNSLPQKAFYDPFKFDLSNAQEASYSRADADYFQLDPILLDYRSESGTNLVGQLSVFGTLIVGGAIGILTADVLESHRQTRVKRRVRLDH